MVLKELILQANHLTSLLHFYKEIMDLPVTFSDDNSLKILAGNSMLIFEKNEIIPDPYYHIAFTISSNKFEEAYKWFTDRTSLLWIPDDQSFVADFQRWNAKSFYFYDPAGNILEIIVRFDLESNSDKPFSGASICNISEIGIVFPALDFSYEVHQFMQEFHLGYFEKQPPGPNFKVAGDDEGLFIMVPEGRDWSPGTGKKSVIFPLSVTFENGGHQFIWTSEMN